LANVRGNSFMTINQWLIELLQEVGYKKFISRMRPPVARVLSQGEGWSWYPIEYLTEVYEEITEHLGNGNGRVLENLGRVLADADVGGGPKTRLSLIPMARVVARVPHLWSRFKDCGEFKTLSVDEHLKRAVLVLAGYEGGQLHCYVIGAWLERVCTLLSGRKVEVRERSCRWKEGGDGCYWEVSWE
jgi:hypothetical protein